MPSDKLGGDTGNGSSSVKKDTGWYPIHFGYDEKTVTPHLQTQNAVLEERVGSCLVVVKVG